LPQPLTPMMTQAVPLLSLVDSVVIALCYR
jgi:hypothetical protein